jgi:hypothetical protein
VPKEDAEEYVDWIGEEAEEDLEPGWEGGVWTEDDDWGSASFNVDTDAFGFTARIFPQEKMSRDEKVPLDQLLSSLFAEIRSSRVEKAMFFAAAIDRMGYSEGLWKNLGIFSFREIGYGYPEAPIYVYDYYCSWLEEMRRHREELACRLRYACTHALLSRFLSMYDHVNESTQDETKGGYTPSSGPMRLEDFVSTHLSEEERRSLLDDIRVLMTTPDSVMDYPQYDTPCSCHLRKTKTMNHKSQAETEDALFSELEMTGHLTTARHILFSIVNYLCALPKTSLSLDVSFHTAYKCQGKLMPEDWNIRLSFTELDYALFQIRKTREEAVQQLAICLCCSIMHGDEERAIRMTDLFHVWKEEELFWDSLISMCTIHRECYQWVRPYLEKYRDAWRSFDSCKDYFIEGCRTALFTATLLIVRGQPPRDRHQHAASFAHGSSSSRAMPSPAVAAFRQNLVITPSQINYSRDYVKIIYGSQTPSYCNLDFLSSYSQCPLSLHESSFHKDGDMLERMLKDPDEECLRLTHPDVSMGVTDEFLASDTIRSVIMALVPSVAYDYPGNPSCAREPYVVRCYTDPSSRRKTRPYVEKDFRSSLRVKKSSANMAITNINFQGMINNSMLNPKRRSISSPGGRESLSRSSPSVGGLDVATRIKGLDVDDEKLEVSINEAVIDWTTDLGRRWGKGYSHAQKNSHNYSARARMPNQYDYAMCNEPSIQQQEKDAKRNADERIIAMRGRVDGLSGSLLLAPSLSEDTEDWEASETYEDDGLRFTWEWRRFTHVSRRLKDLECTSWYDPGFIMLYRMYSAEADSLQLRLTDMSASPENETLSDRQKRLFKGPNDYFLNLINIQGGKDEISTRTIARDDILKRLDQLEELEESNNDGPSGYGTPRSSCPSTPSYGSFEDRRIKSVAQAGRSQSMEELTRGLSSRCTLRTPSPSIQSSEGEGSSRTTLGKSRKRWYRVSETDDDEDPQEQPGEPEEPEILTEPPEENEVPALRLSGRPDPTNIVVEHRVFCNPFAGSIESDPIRHSMAYVVSEGSTNEMFSVVSLGPFQTKQDIQRMVTDIDFRESLGMPNIYSIYAMNWARIGYKLMEAYIRADMDPVNEGTVSAKGKKYTPHSSKEKGEGGNVLDSIMNTMDTMKKMRKISSVRVPSGYTSASEFILESHPFYPDCAMSNISPEFGSSSLDKILCKRDIVPVDNTDPTQGYYLHYTVKICAIPFLIYSSDDKWNAFVNFSFDALDLNYDHKQLELNFLSLYDSILEVREHDESAYENAYKLMETVIYHGLTRGVHASIEEQARILCESMVYTYHPIFSHKDNQEGEEEQDGSSCSRELVFSLSPMYMDHLTMASPSHIPPMRQEEELAEYYPSASYFFQYLRKCVVGGDRFRQSLPPRMHGTIVEIMESEEGELWYGDTTNLWSSIMESNMHSMPEATETETETEDGEVSDEGKFMTIEDIVLDPKTITRMYNRMCSVTPSLME